MRSLPGCGPSSGTVVDIVCNRQDSGAALNSSVTEAGVRRGSELDGQAAERAAVINLVRAVAVVWLLLLR